MKLENSKNTLVTNQVPVLPDRAVPHIRSQISPLIVSAPCSLAANPGMIGPTQQEFVDALGTTSLLVRDPNAGSKFNFGAVYILSKVFTSHIPLYMALNLRR